MEGASTPSIQKANLELDPWRGQVPLKGDASLKEVQDMGGITPACEYLSIRGAARSLRVHLL